MRQQLTYARRIGASLVSVAPLLFGATAHAAEAEQAQHEAAHQDEHAAHEEEHEEEREEVGANVLTLKLAGLQIVAPGEETSGTEGEEPEPAEDEVLRRAGISIGYERVLVTGWLEAEISVLFAPGTGGLTLPIDLVLKMPFELSPELEAFVGLGLATEWFEAGHRETAYGVGSELGAYYWFGPHFGLALEGEYNLLLHPETAHEVVLAGGGAFRF